MNLLYKYLETKHLIAFREKGEIKINTLGELRPIMDETEGKQIQTYAPIDEPITLSSENKFDLSNTLHFPKNTPTAIHIDAGGTFKSYIEAKNAFVFCTSIKLNPEFWRKFSKDAFYTIVKPKKFIKLLYRRLKLDKEFGLSQLPMVGLVKYTLDKDRTIASPHDINSVTNRRMGYKELCFTKKEKFREEAEFRMLFIPKNPETIKPHVINFPELRKCCVFTK
jgi:hypothetical protein